MGIEASKREHQVQLIDYAPKNFEKNNHISSLSVSTIEGGRGFVASVPGDGTKTTPSGDWTIRSPAWSGSLPLIRFVSPGGWSNKSPGGTIFVPFPSKMGINLLHPRPLPSR